MVAGIDDILNKVRDFAAQAHAGQVRKFSDDPYIVHPVRVMGMCREYTGDVAILSAALLHDVLEDTEVSKSEMEEFLLGIMEAAQAHRTVKLVTELTDVYVKSAYPKWNRRKRKLREAERHEQTSAASQTVKYADIIDNVRGIAETDSDFVPTFLYECRALLKRITKGDGRLYSKAVEAVNAEIRKLKRSRQGE